MPRDLDIAAARADSSYHSHFDWGTKRYRGIRTLSGELLRM